MVKVAAWRYGVLLGGAVLLAVTDFVLAPRTDPHAAQGRGYGHRVTTPQGPGHDASRGFPRVAFNFRHFFHWWLAYPPQCRAAPGKLLSSDGNSLTTNLAGHLGGSFALSLAGVFLAPRPAIILILGTGVNIFHEYVAEGQYADPSFVDLWLDQLGLALAVLLFVALRRRARVSGNNVSMNRPTTR